jgi:uncharacterized protein YkwD
MRRTLAGLIALALALAAGRAAAEDKKDETKFKPSEYEQMILDLVNKERAKEKLPELKPNAILFKMAREHSANMAKQGKQDHFLDGKGPLERAKDAGYKGAVGENVAAASFDTPADVVQGWMESKGHRENILRKEFVEIGVGMARSDKGDYYFTLTFGVPRK